MAFAELAGLPVLDGALFVPRSGVWHSDLTLDGDTLPSGPLTLTLGDSSWACTLMRGAAAEGRVEMRVVGGAGGMARAIPGQSYVNASARVPMSDILKAAGETIASFADASILATLLPAWSRVAGLASAQLGELLRAVGGLWRILPDGTTWIGSETYPDAPAFDYDVLSRMPREGRWELGSTEGYKLLPGTVFEGGKVAYVEHTIGASALRSVVYFE